MTALLRSGGWTATALQTPAATACPPRLGGAVGRYQKAPSSPAIPKPRQVRRSPAPPRNSTPRPASAPPSHVPGQVVKDPGHRRQKAGLNRLQYKVTTGRLEYNRPGRGQGQPANHTMIFAIHTSLLVRGIPHSTSAAPRPGRLLSTFPARRPPPQKGVRNLFRLRPPGASGFTDWSRPNVRFRRKRFLTPFC